VLLQLYRALILSKPDSAASCMVPPRSQTLYNSLFHSPGICLATGAFPARSLESLYVESVGSPLSVHRNLLKNYIAKLASQPKHSTHAAVLLHPPRQVRVSPLDPRPLGVRL
jgi:hypothetical protein